ncbi:hypothetical protein [Streptomyces cavernicola]|uniref:Lipoprotein n=1 Tax=Streptomyces cavernicola TaxID=3043613 RepID=A0ABT6S3X4_9ACTN|nr:hypothetical protein [Streptomyces sp. B-S-A6]MDI3402720.1 hypothetical protein [Streptomyces sp. B-S-A6]
MKHPLPTGEGIRIRALARAVVPLAALLPLTACGVGENICTLRDSPSGVGVSVAPEFAPEAAEAELVACWDGRCHSGGMPLQKELREAAQPSEPPTAWPGFAMMDGLPEDGKKIRVRLVLKDERGTPLLDDEVMVVTELTYPNGRECSPGGPQAHVKVTKDGKLTAL